MSNTNIIILIVLLAGAYGFYEAMQAKKLKESQKAYIEKLAQLKVEYENLLNSGNKSQALNAGRAYYSWLRKTAKVMEGENGSLTIYDEQAITNDLSTM